MDRADRRPRKSRTAGARSRAIAHLAVVAASRSELFPDIPLITDFVPDYEASARQTKSRKAGLSAQWVAGYLSGSNVQAGDNYPDALVGTDFDGLMAWVDNYCRANPHDLVGTAALKLFEELQARAQRR